MTTNPCLIYPDTTIYPWTMLYPGGLCDPSLGGGGFGAVMSATHFKRYTPRHPVGSAATQTPPSTRRTGR